MTLRARRQRGENNEQAITARLSALATEQLPGRIPHRDCKTPIECLKASACLDGWHCAHGRPDDILDRK